VAEAIELARAIDQLPCRLVVVGIEGIRFEWGELRSAEVADAVERLAQRIAKYGSADDLPEES
jgi:Ni,Fe-hydrogenase maturation factor